MGLLDFPIIVLRFPQGIEDMQNTLALEVDATGDVHLILPARIETSVDAAKAFSNFWSGNDKEKLMNLLREIFGTWTKPFSLAANWKSYSKRLKKEFNGELLGVLSKLEKLLQNPFAHFNEKFALEDLGVLEVQTRSQNSPEPFLITKIDWKGDFLQTVAPVAIRRPDVFGCHLKGVELALFLKSTLADFITKLIKRLVMFL